MLAHTPNKIIRTYRRPSVDVYKQAYIDGLDSITTDKITIIDFRSPEVKKTQKRKFRIRIAIKIQKEQHEAEMVDMKDRMDL